MTTTDTFSLGVRPVRLATERGSSTGVRPRRAPPAFNGLDAEPAETGEIE
jgi:hypothetical protein